VAADIQRQEELEDKGVLGVIDAQSEQHAGSSTPNKRTAKQKSKSMAQNGFCPGVPY